jgi:hypothetical protein
MKYIREAVSISGGVHEQCLHRVDSGRADSFQKTLPLEGEQCTRNFMCDAVGPESIELQENRWGEVYIKGRGMVMSACTSIALYPAFQWLPSSRVFLRDKSRLLRLTLMRLVASGVSLPLPIRLAPADGSFGGGATKELPKEGLVDVVLSLCPSLRKVVGKISR